MDCSPPGSSAHGIFQARILEWVAISSSRGSSHPRDQTLISCVSCIDRHVLYHCATRKAYSGNCLVAKAEGKIHFKEKQCSEKTAGTFALCVPLEWLSGQHRRTPVHEKICARPFLMKGPLITGGIVALLTCFPQRSLFPS